MDLGEIQRNTLYYKSAVDLCARKTKDVFFPYDEISRAFREMLPWPRKIFRSVQALIILRSVITNTILYKKE